MTYHKRALIISVILHALLIATVVSAGSLMKDPSPPRLITFDIAKGDIKEIDLSKPPSAPMKKEVPQKKVHRVPPKETDKIIPKETIQTSETSEVPLPEVVPAEAAEQSVSLSQQEINGNEAGVDRGGVDAAWQGGSETAEEKYLREHFMYIKDRILRRIQYPDQARRMGWQGKVVTSFVIHADGKVSEVKIISGSGFKVLDRNAVSTIEEASPFPKPPIAARIIIPITYRLTSG